MSSPDPARFRWQILAWWLLSALAVSLIPSPVKFHLAPWSLGAEREFQVLAAGMAFLAAALSYEALVNSGGRLARLLKALLITMVAFGAASVLVAHAGAPLSRATFIIACVVALLLMAARVITARLSWIAVAMLAAVDLGAGLYSRHLQQQKSDEFSQATLPTEFYRLDIETYPVTHGTELGHSQGGALASFGDLQIVAAVQGNLFSIRQLTDGKLKITPIDLRVPVGREELRKTGKQPAHELRVTGLAASRSGQGGDLFAAYDTWNPDEDCFSTRVSRIHLTLDGPTVKASGDWAQVYQSKPCLKVTTGYDFLQTGGRIAILPGGKLLLTLGDRGINGLNGPSLAEKPDNDYGKVIQLDVDGGEASIFTMGHRNPQGLAIAASGHVWETEHGPQGGDEVNLLVQGGDYGWPSFSYGTDYGHFVWPFNADARNHGSRSEPAFAFVPSIGVSNLVEAHSAKFPAWDGDLIVSSLRAQTLYRLRVRDARVIYSEPIPIDHRIRDLIWSSSGDLILWTDDGYLLLVSRAAQETVYDQCSGCHEPHGATAALGPPLRSILGRKVADHFEFGYSPALRRLGGDWTESRLDEFLRDPAAYAPGTKMTFRGIPDDAERAKVVQFLKDYE